MTNNSLQSFYDPYVYQTLLTIVGQMVTVQTVRGSVRGSLKTVMPDHLVLNPMKLPFSFAPSKLSGFFQVNQKKKEGKACLKE